VKVSVDDAAQMIGVSSATVRNWAKSGQICPVSTRPLSFLKESVLNLKSQIGSASFDRLKTRANKVGSTSNFLPEEYAENPHVIAHIANLVSYVKEERLEIGAVMLLAALRFLEASGEVNKTKNSPPFTLESYTLWARQSVKSVIVEWMSAFDTIVDATGYNHIYELIPPQAGDDFLGLLYQSVFSEGNKSEQGSYYTPSQLVEESLSHIVFPIKTFMDPCCGTGKYLLLAAKKFNLIPENVFGFDCDNIAVNITKINLLMAYKGKEFSPNIWCIDSLSELATGDIFCETNDLLGHIDAIATNPPWGAYKNLKSKNTCNGKVKSGETFSMFLEKSIQLLRKGGRLSFILPESLLKVKVHSDIREIILNETKIATISMLGRRFTGVFSPVIRLDLIKERAPDSWFVSVEQNGKTEHIEQERFNKNEQFTFDVAVGTDEERILKKIYSNKHTTLAKNAEWALGIVTGDNKKHLIDTQTHDTEAVFRGSDVCQYYLGEPKSFITFTPGIFQQVAPERFFRATEKLVYKFISNKLAFAYDDKQRLTLNSANIVIPSIPGMGIKVVLAFLNSAVFQYIFEKKFSTHKVLRGDLEKLPFPFVEQELQKQIENHVDSAIINQKTPDELELLIFSTFRLDAEEILTIKQTVGV
jgi:hypothetical protein